MTERGTYIIACSYGNKAIHTYFRELAETLHSRGNKAILVYDRRRTDVENHDADIPVYTWPSARPTKWQDLMFLRMLVRKYNPDCIMASFGAVNMCLVGGRMFGIPVRLGWMMTLYTQTQTDSSIAFGMRERLALIRKRMVLKLATNLVTFTEAVVADAITWYRARREDFILLPYALPVPDIGNTTRKEHAIVAVGRLDPSKGHGFLIKALPAIAEEVPDAHLELIGDGPLRGTLEHLANELGVSAAVTFAGARPYDYVLDAMATAAVVVSPSLQEAGGLINVEAQSVSTPVVASRVDGIQEIIVDGETGFLVPAGESGGIAEKVVQLLLNPQLRAEMGRKGRAHFEQGYGRGNISKHADAFEHAVASARQRR